MRFRPRVSKDKKHDRWILHIRAKPKRERAYYQTKAEAEVELAKVVALSAREGHAGWAITAEQRVQAARALEILTPLGATLAEAAAHYVAHIEAKSRSIKFSELVTKMLAAKKGDKRSVRHVADLKFRLNRFAEKFGEHLVAEITVTQIDDWLREQGASQQSRENFRKVLHSAFSYALKHGYSPKNPAADAERIKVQRGVPAVLTPAQLRSLFAKAPPEIVPYIALSAFGGLRTAEIECLDWRAIDLGQNLIQVGSDQKTGHRWVEIQPNLANWLAPYKKDSGPVAPRKAMRLRKTAADNAEIIWVDNVLRHSFGSAHAVKFKNTTLTASQMGNTPSVLLKHYRNLITPAAAKEWFDIVPTEADNVIELHTAAH
jgi:integrase